MLIAEKDIGSLIWMHRLTRLMTKVLLKPHQKQAALYFRKYVMHGDQGAETKDKPDQKVLPFLTKTMTAEQLWDALDC